MKWKILLVTGLFALSCRIANAQNSVGNIISGDAKVKVLHAYSGSETLPRPDRIVIQDFAASGDIVIDDSLAARLRERSILHPGSADDADPNAVIRKMRDSFAKSFNSLFDKQNIVTDRVPDVSAIPGPVLIVQGEFVAVNQGNATKRIMLGFGRGASHIRAHVVISLVSEGRKTLLLDCNINSQSGKKPGAIIGMGSGTVAVGAAAGDVGDSKATVLGDASRMGKLVAKQTEAVMVAQKWIPSPSN